MNGDIASACAFRPEDIRHQQTNELLRDLKEAIVELTAEHASLGELIAAYRRTAAELERLEATA